MQVGVLSGQGVDTTGDGVKDSTVVDTTGDGVPDTLVKNPQQPVMGTPMPPAAMQPGMMQQQMMQPGMMPMQPGMMPMDPQQAAAAAGSAAASEFWQDPSNLDKIVAAVHKANPGHKGFWKRLLQDAFPASSGVSGARVVSDARERVNTAVATLSGTTAHTARTAEQKWRSWSWYLARRVT